MEFTDSMSGAAAHQGMWGSAAGGTWTHGRGGGRRDRTDEGVQSCWAVGALRAGR